MWPSTTNIFSLLCLPLLLFTTHTIATTTTTTTTTASKPIDVSPTTGHWLVPRACDLVAAWDPRVPSSYCKSVLETAQYDKDAKKSLHGLAWVALNILKNNVTATKAEVDKMVANGMGDKVVKDALMQCAKMYDEAMDRSVEGLQLFEEKKFAEADEKVVMIQGDGYECELAFTQYPEVKSPLTKQNSDCTWLSVMAALIIRMFDRTYTPWGTSWPQNV